MRERERERLGDMIERVRKMERIRERERMG